MDACKGGWGKEEKNISLPNGRTISWAEFQLAALKAFLASLISPGRVRPPFLSQGLELFRRGVQESGTKLSEFCSHALLVLEVLIHPRALPLIDFESDTNVVDGAKLIIPISIYPGDQKFNTLLSDGTLGKGAEYPESDEDDLYKSWLGNDEVDVADTRTENISNSIVRPFVSKNPSAENQFLVDKVFGAEVPQVSGRREVPIAVSKGIQEATAVGQRIGESGDDEIMTEGQDFRDAIQHSGSMGLQSGTFVLDNSTTSAIDNSSTFGQNVPAPSNYANDIGFMIEHNAESSEESIPDIVDEEPDSN